MRKISVIALVFALAALGAQASELDRVELQGKVHSDLHTALGHSAVELDQPVFFYPERQQDGVMLIRVEGHRTGEVDRILVSRDATLGGAIAEQRPEGQPPEAQQRAAFNVVGGVNRSVIRLYDGINFSGLIMTTDLDWNNLSEISGVNDRASSLKTGSNGVWFFRDRNFYSGDPFLYVPPNTNMANIGTLNNAISAFVHDLP
ncbi:MAG: hypothetical protein AAGN66_07745 [Acidobacteriota bacterium]